jgi:hypothetical protein
VTMIHGPLKIAAEHESDGRRGFRPTPRRRARIAAGLALASVAVGGNVLIYSSLGDKVAVVQITSDVRAGESISAAKVRVVEVSLDPTVPIVAGADLATIIGQHARVHLASGTLLAANLIQPAPLVSAGSSVVAIEVSASRVPAGLRERSRVALVLVADDRTGPVTVEGRVVARDGGDDRSTDGAAISVEVPIDQAASIAAADDVRLVLLDPGADPAMQPSPAAVP